MQRSQISVRPSLRRALAHDRGGVALEYILVTTFSAILSLAALGYIGTVVKDKLSTLVEKMGSSVEVSDIDLGSDEDAP